MGEAATLAELGRINEICALIIDKNISKIDNRIPANISNKKMFCSEDIEKTTKHAKEFILKY